MFCVYVYTSIKCFFFKKNKTLVGTNKDLLCNTGNSTQYSVITYMGKESEKE